MGSFWKILHRGAIFYVNCMGTCSQTAIANGEFGLSEGLPLRVAICPCKAQITSTNGDTQGKGTASQTGEFHGLMVQAYVAGSCAFQWLGCRSFFRERGVATAIGELPASCNSHWRFRPEKIAIRIGNFVLINTKPLLSVVCSRFQLQIRNKYFSCVLTFSASNQK